MRRRVVQRPTPCGKGEMWVLEVPGDEPKDALSKDMAEKVRASIPGGDLAKKRMKPRRYRRRSCWSCPILREMDTMSGVTVIQQLEYAAKSIRALAHECKKRHDGRLR